MKWFRMYQEARTDRKLSALTDRQHRIWFDLLCFASEQPERGVIRNYDRQLLAVEVAGGDVEALDDTLATLERLRILAIDDDAMSFINFVKRQYDYPSDAPTAVAERVSKHRNEQKTRAGRGETTPPKPATTLKRDVTSSNDTDKERDSDSDSDSETQVTNVTCGNAAAAAAPSAPSGTKDLTRNQQLWAVLRDELHYEPHPENRTERGAWNGAIRSLIHVGETPETVRELVAAYRERWPSIDCTPNALVAKLSLIRSPLPGARARASPGGRAVDKSTLNGSTTDYDALIEKRKERRTRETAREPPA